MVEPTFPYIILEMQYSGKFKSISFADTKYIYDQRVYTKDVEVKPIYLDDVKTINDPLETVNQLIQAVTYEIIELHFYTKENELIGYLENSEKITVTDENGTQFLCDLENINKEELGDTTIALITLTFLKRDQDSQKVSTYVDQTWINKKYSTGYNYVSFTNNKNIDSVYDFESGFILMFKTIFMPVIRRSEMQTNDIDVENGSEIINDSNDNLEIVYKLFLTDSEMLDLQKYASRCFYRNGTDWAGFEGYDITNLSFTSQSNAQIVLIPNDAYIDLNEVNIILKKDYTHFYHLEQ